jgi:hypothetical protein
MYKKPNKFLKRDIFKNLAETLSNVSSKLSVSDMLCNVTELIQ